MGARYVTHISIAIIVAFIKVTILISIIVIAIVISKIFVAIITTELSCISVFLKRKYLCQDNS